MSTWLTNVSSFSSYFFFPTVAQKLEGYTCCYLVVCKFLFVVFGFPLASRLGFILHIYMCSFCLCEKNCHILIGCLFVNLRLIHKPCLCITIVSLHGFGSPRRKLSNFIIKFPYNMRSDWLKQHALSVTRAWVDGKLAFKFLLWNFYKRNGNKLFACSKYGSQRPLLAIVVLKLY